MTEWRPAKTVVLAAAVTVGIICYAFVTRNHPTVFGNAEAASSTDYGKMLLGYIVTCLGVLIGSLYRKLSDLKQMDPNGQVDRALFKSVFRSVDLWLGIAGSPLVFSLVLQSASDVALPGFVAIALQNGFCCLAVIEGFTKNKGGVSTKTP